MEFTSYPASSIFLCRWSFELWLADMAGCSIVCEVFVRNGLEYSGTIRSPFLLNCFFHLVFFVLHTLGVCHLRIDQYSTHEWAVLLSFTCTPSKYIRTDWGEGELPLLVQRQWCGRMSPWPQFLPTFTSLYFRVAPMKQGENRKGYVRFRIKVDSCVPIHLLSATAFSVGLPA